MSKSTDPDGTEGTIRPVPSAPFPRGAITRALIVAIAAFMQMLDSSIIATALPRMGADFGVGPVEVGLGIIVYLLAAAIVVPASAWIADRFGARRMFILAMSIFTIASLLCGISGNLAELVAARAIQGGSGALMGAIGQLILVRSVNRSILLRLMNISSIPMLVAPVLGPPLGGFITETLGWRSIFYINIPIGVLGVALALKFLSPSPLDRRPFDGTGFVLNAVTLALLLFGLERLSAPSTRLSAVLSLGTGVLTALLAVRHLRQTDHPILSLAPLRLQTFRIAVVTTLPLIRLPIGALIFVLPILLQVGFGMTAVLSGIALLSHAGGDLLMKPLMTRTFRRFSYRTVLLISTAVTAGGIAACGLLTAATPFSLILGLAALTGCGRSFVMTGLSTLAFDEVTPKMIPSAVTLNQILVQLATALSVALATMAFDFSAWLHAHPSDLVDAADCRLVLGIMGLIGLLGLMALMRLSKEAGDRLSGRSPALAVDE